MDTNLSSIYILMGVSGSGKTTIGQTLALKLGCPYYDGDDFHPPENVAKMSRGIPLDDSDRAPWLNKMADVIRRHIAHEETAVLGCSVLKKSYRRQLDLGPAVVFIFLDGDFDLIWGRMKNRQGHFMKADMLRSQFNILEPPISNQAIHINIDQTIAEIVDEILEALKTSPSSSSWQESA